MSSMLHVKSWRLQEHCSILRQERRTAQLLCEKLHMARRFAPPEEAERLSRMIRQAEQIERYFYEMGNLVDRMYTEFAVLSQKIGAMLDSDLHWYDPLSK